jgi:hypothetical protein
MCHSEDQEVWSWKIFEEDTIDLEKHPEVFSLGRLQEIDRGWEVLESKAYLEFSNIHGKKMSMEKEESKKKISPRKGSTKKLQSN